MLATPLVSITSCRSHSSVLRVQRSGWSHSSFGRCRAPVGVQCKASDAAPGSMAATDQNEERKKLIAGSFRVIPDWPKKGIQFQDITTLLLDPAAYAGVVESFLERFRGVPLDAVACFEARGFFFGPAVALALKLPLVPLRKPRKLPGPVLAESYALEYGTDSLEVHVGALQPGQRVLLVDDLMATGGTLCAGIRLVRKAGAVPVGAAFVMSLPDIGGAKKVAELEPDLIQYTILEMRGD